MARKPKRPQRSNAEALEDIVRRFRLTVEALTPEGLGAMGTVFLEMPPDQLERLLADATEVAQRTAWLRDFIQGCRVLQQGIITISTTVGEVTINDRRAERT